MFPFPTHRPLILPSLFNLTRIFRLAFAAWGIVLFLLAGQPLFAAGPFGVVGTVGWVNLTNGITAWIPVEGATAVPVDVNGWPESDAMAEIFDIRKDMPYRGPDGAGINEDVAGTYNMSFIGQATISANTEVSGGVTVRDQQYEARPRLHRATFLPGIAHQTVTIDPSQDVPQIFANNVAPGSGLIISQGTDNLYPLRATGSGVYAISLYGYAGDGDAQVNVYVDDNQIGTLQLGTTAQQSAPLSVTLGPGFHTLSLAAANADTTVLPPLMGAIFIQLTSGGGQPVVPSAPANLTAISGNDEVTLHWASATTATAYSVLRSSQSGGPYTLVAQTNTNAYVDTTAANGSFYYYVIAASNSVGQGGFSPQASVIPAPPGVLSPPANVQIDFGGDANTFFGSGLAIVSWSPVPNAAGYNIYRATSGGTSTLLNASPQIGTRYTDLTVNVGTTYTYTVSTVNAAGESSAPSAEVTADPVEQIRQPPTNLSAQNRDGFIFLKWDPDPLTIPESEPTFNLERSETPGGPYSTVCQITTYNAYDYTALPGITYYYVVSATNDAGASMPSNESSATATKAGAEGYESGSDDVPQF